MDEEIFTKFLKFRQISKPDGINKTYKYEVSNSVTVDVIGLIKWYNPWRRYTFQCVIPVILDKTCMQQIIEIINKLEEERKNG